MYLGDGFFFLLLYDYLQVSLYILAIPHTTPWPRAPSSISITTASLAHHPPQWRQRHIQGTRLSTVTAYSIPQWRTGCGWARHWAGKSLATPLETGFWRGMRGIPQWVWEARDAQCLASPVLVAIYALKILCLFLWISEWLVMHCESVRICYLVDNWQQ